MNRLDKLIKGKRLLAIILIFAVCFTFTGCRMESTKTGTGEAGTTKTVAGETGAGEAGTTERVAGETETEEAGTADAKTPEEGQADLDYSYEEYPLERNGIALHLDCMKLQDTQPEKNILLIHGVTYSSHEFDINYEDYSLVRFLARNGYAVWRLDIAGFGQSGEVEDGFLPDTKYASEDINAAVEKICQESGQSKIDVLGWSWGTTTVSLFAGNHPEHLRKLVLYAPILSGIGEVEVTEPFHHNTWEHAADDFQKKEDGTFDYSIADPTVIEVFCSSSWHYDRESSPNGGRRDLCVSDSVSLIDLTKITVPTLVIYGDKDPYLNYERVDAALNDLPQGSVLEKIEGASHVAYIEKPYYRDFQNRLMEFLR